MNINNLKITDESNKFLFAECPNHSSVNKKNFCINKVPHNGRPKGFWYCFSCGLDGQMTSKQVDELCKKPIDYSEQQVKSEIDWDMLHKEYFYKEFAYCKAVLLAEKWNVKPTIIWELGCGWDGQAHTFPMYELDNIIGIQRQFANGFKCCVPGSALGLFVPITKSTGDVLFIPEGVSDLACLLNLGFCGIARPNALVGKKLVYNWLRRFNPSYRLIVIVGDNDEAGVKGAVELQNYIDSEHSRTKIFIPDYKDPVTSEYCKDVRQLTKAYGKERVKNCLEVLIK